MKVKVADSTGCPVPQFIIYAETDEDKAILKAFCTFKDEAKDKWEFTRMCSRENPGVEVKPEERLKEIEYTHSDSEHYALKSDLDWLIARCKRLTEALVQAEKDLNYCGENHSDSFLSHGLKCAEEARKALEEE